MNRFAWAGLLEAARSVGVKPVEFWRLTPAEFAFLVGRSGQAPLTRAGLADLAAAFPDLKKDQTNERD